MKGYSSVRSLRLLERLNLEDHFYERFFIYELPLNQPIHIKKITKETRIYDIEINLVLSKEGVIFQDGLKPSQDFILRLNVLYNKEKYFRDLRQMVSFNEGKTFIEAIKSVGHDGRDVRNWRITFELNK